MGYYLQISLLQSDFLCNLDLMTAESNLRVAHLRLNRRYVGYHTFCRSIKCISYRLSPVGRLKEALDHLIRAKQLL